MPLRAVCRLTRYGWGGPDPGQAYPRTGSDGASPDPLLARLLV